MKKILSLDLGITSVGYSVMGELENDRYSLFDYGVFMFDTPYDQDWNSKKSIHSNHVSHSKLYELRKQRKINLSKLFEEFGFGKQDELLEQERMNVFINKWELRGKKAFEQKLTFQELFSIFYLLAKHRGYKSLDTDDLLEELCERFGIVTESKKDKKQDEKGRIKQALKTVEVLKLQYPHKTVARIIYEVEIKKSNPVFRNHDNYNYMIRREHINEEIRAIILAQKELGLFDTSIDVKSLISKLIETIDDQKNSSNDLSLLGECEFIKGQKVAHQYSLLSDIFKMYQAVSNITFNSKPIVKITKEQIKQVADDFFGKVKSGKNISEIKYKDIRKVLNLGDEFKIFNKDDSRVIKDKKHENSIIKFHFVNNLSKFDKNFIANILNHKDMYLILQEIFDVFKEEKQPEPIYNKLDAIFKTYSLCTDEYSKRETILELIINKSRGRLTIYYDDMVTIIHYF